MLNMNPMTDSFEIAQIKAALQAQMDRQGIGAKPLAKKANLGETAVRDFLQKENNDIKIGTLTKLANALRCSVADLISGNVTPVALGPNLFVKGEVAAGQWRDAYEWPEDDWQSFTGRSDVTADIQHRFGLRVSGDSMDQIYPEGTIVECVSVFGRAEIEPGKKVVVLRRKYDQSVEATVKELAEINGALWLRPRSSNPIHQSIDLGKDNGEIEETQIIAVVVASVRPE